MCASDTIRSDPRKAVFDTLRDVRAGMLGLTAAGDGLQPMTHFSDADAGLIWFISSTETDLVQSLGMGEDADYVVISRDHDVHISLRGKLYQLHDDATLDRLWTPDVAAWFDGCRDDPRIALLRFEPEVSDIWASRTDEAAAGMEAPRASPDASQQPDGRVKATARFPTAA